MQIYTMRYLNFQQGGITQTQTRLLPNIVALMSQMIHRYKSFARVRIIYRPILKRTKRRIKHRNLGIQCIQHF